MIIRRATPADVEAVLATRLIADGRLHDALLGQLASGPAYAIASGEAAGFPLVVGGFVAFPDWLELWLSVVDGGLGRKAAGVIMAIRRIIRAQTGLLATHVAAGNRDGERLMTALGFAPTGRWSAAHQCWERDNG
jgi:hypothetical protein